MFKAKGKIFYITGVLVLFIGLAIFFFFYFFHNSTQPPLPSPEKQQKLTLNDFLDQTKKFKIKTEDLEIAQYTPPTKDSCRQKKTKLARQRCEDKIRLKEIMKNKNINACLQLKTLELRDSCLERLAADSLNYNACRAIIDVGKRAVCIDALAINSQDKSNCDKFFSNEPIEKQECYDRISAFRISDSGKQDDIFECEKIKTLEYPNLCLQRSFEKKYNNDCNKVPKEFKDYCWTIKIIDYADTAEKCALIPLESYRKYCLLKVKAGNKIEQIAKIDSDGDGLADSDELFTRLDPYNPDTDGDGLNDYEEIFNYETNPTSKDSDNDGLTDGDEVKKYKTNPANPDTDGDGILDGQDNRPLDRANDADNDGLKDEEEKKWGTDPNNPDTDGDGLNDYEEIENGTNPVGAGWQHDADNDGLIDADERFYHTDPLNPDTDGDGYPDGEEVVKGYNPLGPGKLKQ